MELLYCGNICSSNLKYIESDSKSTNQAYVSCISNNVRHCGLFLFRNLFKSPKRKLKRSHISDKPRFDDSDDELAMKSPLSYEDPGFYRSQDRNFALQSCSLSERGMLNVSSNASELIRDILE